MLLKTIFLYLEYLPGPKSMGPRVYMAFIAILNTCSQKPLNCFDILCRGILEICTMSNRYGPAMRIFTKTLKIPFSILREKSFLSVVYVDDSYLHGDDYEDCFSYFLNTVQILNLLDSQSPITNLYSYQHNLLPP